MRAASACAPWRRVFSLLQAGAVRWRAKSSGDYERNCRRSRGGQGIMKASDKHWPPVDEAVVFANGHPPQVAARSGLKPTLSWPSDSGRGTFMVGGSREGKRCCRRESVRFQLQLAGTRLPMNVHWVVVISLLSLVMSRGKIIPMRLLRICKGVSCCESV